MLFPSQRSILLSEQCPGQGRLSRRDARENRGGHGAPWRTDQPCSTRRGAGKTRRALAGGVGRHRGLFRPLSRRVSAGHTFQIGIASCRESVWKLVYISFIAVKIKKKKQKDKK